MFKDVECRIVFAGSILDLSRRTLEDMVYMHCIKEKGKDEYSKQFKNFASIEMKSDLDFLTGADISTKKDIVKTIEDDYKKAPNDLKKRHTSGWAIITKARTNCLFQLSISIKVVKNHY